MRRKPGEAMEGLVTQLEKTRSNSESLMMLGTFGK
jgi:hypothetical protein